MKILNIPGGSSSSYLVVLLVWILTANGEDVPSDFDVTCPYVTSSVDEWIGDLDIDTFIPFSCSECFKFHSYFRFKNSPPEKVPVSFESPWMAPPTFRPPFSSICKSKSFTFVEQIDSGNTTKNETFTAFMPTQCLVPDPRNRSTIDPICRTLAEEDCTAWLSCCSQAEACCRNIASKKKDNSAPFDGETHCRPVWDGWSCFEATPRGTTAKTTCPNYISRIFDSPDIASMGVEATRTCTALNNVSLSGVTVENGLWLENDQDPSLETRRSYLTDYSPCFKARDYRTLTQLYVQITCRIISLVAVIPAIIICICNRNIRRQKLFRIHISLFIALGLYTIFGLGNEFYRLYLLLGEFQGEFILPMWCIALSVLPKHFSMSAYFWMSLEAIYLCRNLRDDSMSIRNPLGIYQAIGWAMPITFTTCYVLTRSLAFWLDEHECWIPNMGGIEYIFHIPKLACLSVNIVLLVWVIHKRYKMSSSASIPSAQTSAVKQMAKIIVLSVPIFGVPQIFVMVTPEKTYSGVFAYDLIASIVTLTQPFFAAVFLCYTSPGVQQSLDMSRRLSRARESISTKLTMWRRRSSGEANNHTNSGTAKNNSKSARLSTTNDTPNHPNLEVPNERTKFLENSSQL